MHQVIENFLSPEAHNKILSVMGNMDTKNFTPFPWYLSRNVSDSNNEQNVNEFYMYHPFYWDYAPASEYLGDLLQEAVNKLDMKSIIRIKGNLYPSTEKIHVHDPHIDLPYKHRAAVYFVNENNGYTTMPNGEQVQSKANSVVLFDASQPHSSSTCTDDKFRITINFNFF